MLGRNSIFMATIGLSGLVTAAQAQTVIYRSGDCSATDVYRADWLRAPLGFSAGFTFDGGDYCYGTRLPGCTGIWDGLGSPYAYYPYYPLYGSCGTIYGRRVRDCEPRRYDCLRRYDRNECDRGGFSLGFWFGDRDRHDSNRSYYRGRLYDRGRSDYRGRSYDRGRSHYRGRSYGRSRSDYRDRHDGDRSGYRDRHDRGRSGYRDRHDRDRSDHRGRDIRRGSSSSHRIQHGSSNRRHSASDRGHRSRQRSSRSGHTQRRSSHRGHR
jgi:hypothetical protein